MADGPASGGMGSAIAGRAAAVHADFASITATKSPIVFDNLLKQFFPIVQLYDRIERDVAGDAIPPRLTPSLFGASQLWLWYMMAPSQLTSSTWTIRFRHHRTTVLLPIDPSQSIASIKSDLLAALQQTTPTGRLSDATPLPDSPDDIILAKPVDINNAEAGWRALRAENGAKEVAAARSKGKGKVGADADGVDAETLKSMGIKDNALLAFKFASSSHNEAHGGKGKRVDAAHGGPDGDGETPTGMDVDGEEEEEQEPAEEWDVVMPTWDDQYGVTNTGDAGALKEFDK